MARDLVGTRVPRRVRLAAGDSRSHPRLSVFARWPDLQVGVESLRRT
jgi:hypothetical protein